MKIFKLMAVLAGEIPGLYAGGGKGAPKPIATPPPLAPEPETQETLAPTPIEEETKKARIAGAKSLQIPLGTIGGDKPLNI